MGFKNKKLDMRERKEAMHKGFRALRTTAMEVRYVYRMYHRGEWAWARRFAKTERMRRELEWGGYR